MTTYTRSNLPAGTVLMNRRVRIVQAFPSLSADEQARINGRTGTCKWEQPDSDGDIYVTFDEPIAENGRDSSYVREWAFIDEHGYTIDLTPSEAAQPTHHEARLNALIDAVYSAAERHGYREFLAGVMEEAGIPLRSSERKLRVRGQRVVSLYDNSPVSDALGRLRIGETLPGASAEVTRVIAEVCVTVPWPEVEGEHHDCDDLNNSLPGDEWAQIPDDVIQRAGLQIGVRGDATTLRTWMSNQRKIANNYGATVTCTYCG